MKRVDAMSGSASVARIRLDERFHAPVTKPLMPYLL